MKKIIFVSNHKGFIKFNAPYMEWLKNNGWIVDDAAPGFEPAYSDSYDTHFDVCIDRNPLSIKNIKAIKQLRQILIANEYNMIHCHTPMGASVARISALGIKGITILYTAHGFHFYKGASLKNWIIYFPIELLLKCKTDYLITINNEDYSFAKRWKMGKRGIYKINGVGFRQKFSPVSTIAKENIRNKLGIRANDFVILYTAQFIPRKNHAFIIKNIPKLVEFIPEVKVVFVGSGDLLDICKSEVEKFGVNENVLFAGARSDVEQFCQMADMYVSSSVQEGLCVSNLEAMACGLPLVLSDIRGQNDVCEEDRNGFLFKLGDSEKFISSIYNIYSSMDLRHTFGENNKIDVNKFSLETSLNAMGAIYKEIEQLCV